MACKDSGSVSSSLLSGSSARQESHDPRDHLNFTESELDAERQYENKEKSSKWRMYIPSFYKLVLISLALYGYISLCRSAALHFFPSSFHFSYPKDISEGGQFNEDCDCGSSIAEAKSRGCIYDALASAWLPEYCRDDELTAEFNRSGPLEGGKWPYWADKKGQIPITTDDIAMMAETMDHWYSIKEWHVVHCNFYWRKRFRMKETGKLMERRNDNIKHIRHCGDVVLDPAPMDSLRTIAGVVLNSAGHQ